MGSVHNAHELPRFFTVGDKHEFDPEKWTSTPPNGNGNGHTQEPLPLPKRDAETHVKMLIVGAGFVGLISALECWRKGHDVVGILDRKEGPNYSGDLIIIQPWALGVLRHCPQMCRELENDNVTAGTYYCRYNGELIDEPSEPDFNAPEHLSERTSRPGGFPYCGAVHICRSARNSTTCCCARLGFTVDYDQRVDIYSEDETAGLAGVVITNHDASMRTGTAHVGKLRLHPKVYDT